MLRCATQIQNEPTEPNLKALARSRKDQRGSEWNIEHENAFQNVQKRSRMFRNVPKIEKMQNEPKLISEPQS